MNADLDLEPDAARARIAHPHGVNNGSPWPYVLGISFALFAIWFAAFAATREGANHRRERTPVGDNMQEMSPPPAASETLIWVE